MPSVSKAQQSIMGQAYAIKTGSMKPSDLNPKYRSKIESIAKRMSKSEIKRFASTKRKGLPQHVSENTDLNEIDINEISGISTVTPLVNVTGAENYEPKGPAGIKPFLDTDAKQKNKGKRNLNNLKDYRDWINSKG